MLRLLYIFLNDFIISFMITQISGIVTITNLLLAFAVCKYLYMNRL